MAQITEEQYANGVLVGTTTVTVPDAVVNGSALRDKAAQALTGNQTFLALAAPTAAQNAQQIVRLTRQVNALIRLVASVLDDTSGT